MDKDTLDEDRVRAALQVEVFIDLLSKRYNLTPDDVVEAVRWVKQQRDWHQKLRQASAVSVLTALIGALLISVWEGIKSLLRLKGG